MILRSTAAPHRFLHRLRWGNACLIFHRCWHPHDGFIWTHSPQLQPVAAVLCIPVWIAVAERLSADVLHQKHEAGVDDGGANKINNLTGNLKIGVLCDKGARKFEDLTHKQGGTNEGEEEK